MAFAQDPSGIKFEVASVKVATRDDDAPTIIRGGPGTPDPERVTYQRINLNRLLCVAYGLDFDQIFGPSWVGSELYTLNATVPPGASKEQLKLMLRDLLAERFHLKLHFIKKDFAVYELSVAKGGPKLKKSGEGPYIQQPGFPAVGAGRHFVPSVVPPRTRRDSFRDTSISDLINRLRFVFGTPVGANSLAVGRIIDKTGVEGNFDFTLEFVGGWGPGGASPPPLVDGQQDSAPFLIDALRQQLGLTLIEGKAPLDVLVVEHADRIPTEN
jgi:uncharacterized protein (TIGR03435 family)